MPLNFGLATSSQLLGRSAGLIFLVLYESAWICKLTVGHVGSWRTKTSLLDRFVRHDPPGGSNDRRGIVGEYDIDARLAALKLRQNTRHNFRVSPLPVSCLDSRISLHERISNATKMLYVPNRIYDQIAFLFGFGIEFLAYRIESFGCIRSRIGRSPSLGALSGPLLWSASPRLGSACHTKHCCQNDPGRDPW